MRGRTQDTNCEVAPYSGANHGFLYHVHHIVGVYVTLYVDMLAVGAHNQGGVVNALENGPEKGDDTRKSRS